MKKLLSLAALSFTLLQSCTQDELDVAPKQISSTTPAGINIESAAKEVSEFLASGAKAILLKPVDNNPNTHLTTLFYADNNGNIVPIVENFEVKQVEVTKKGAYVLTNYTDAGQPLAFFVDYDLNWVQLKGVGEYVGLMKDDILFKDGSVLKTQTLKVDKTDTKFVTKSDNLVLVETNDGYSVINTETGVKHVSAPGDEMISLNDNSLALLIIKGEGSDLYTVLDMKTGNMGSPEPGSLDMPKGAVRDASGYGIIAISHRQFKGEQPKTIISNVSFNFDSNGMLNTSPSNVREWDGTPLETYAYDPKKVLLANNVLDNVTMTKEAGYYLYYSGTKGGQPMSGIYDFSTQKTIFSVNDIFSSISFLMPL